MSRLLHLYPAAWRDRYEAELVDMLRERPVGVTGSVDIVHGAIDAHLHPELTGGAPHTWTHRLPGLIATTAGLIWSWYLIRIFLAAPDQEWGSAIGIAVVLMFLAVPGDYMTAYARRIAITLTAIVVAIILARMLPWSIGDGFLNISAGIGAYLMVGAGMLTLAALRAGIGTGFRWLLIAGGLLVPITIAIPVMGGFGPNDPGGLAAMVVASLPYGIAWAIVGLRMTFRGSVTIHDAPTPEPTMEVSAA